jgi:GT2 family glycosyltransferase
MKDVLKKQLTAIITTFLRDDCLFKCLSSFKKYYPEINFIVADNGKLSYEKKQKIEEMGGKYKIFPFNCGLSYMRNCVVKTIKTPYFLLLEDDFIFQRKTKIEKLLTLMDIADIAGGTFIQDGIVKKYAVKFIKGKKFIYKDVKIRRFKYKNVYYKKVDMIPNFFIAKTDLPVKWDNSIKIGYEHPDFFLQAQEKGLRILYCEDVIIKHTRTRFRVYDIYRNKYCINYFLDKWGFQSITNTNGKTTFKVT